ncbi:MAG: ATP-dependent helicase HrpB, partial [Planctomycetota bacterium]
MIQLPIDAHVSRALNHLRTNGSLVLTAAPGAGKSTRIAPALIELGPGEILLLQPRRIAARSLAARIASERGWRLGDEVGYSVRHERVGNRATRLWVMTEGTLTRRLADDPLLEGVSCVVLDEFHERSLHADLALAWCAELRRSLRPDLRICVMSATMDPRPIAAFLGDAPIMEVAAPCHPVELREGRSGDVRSLPERVAEAVANEAKRSDAGDMLVFLPGVGEIRGCAAAIGERDDLLVLPLHGGLPPEEQDAALKPADRRKVVLATNVAETSLTIPGIRTVIDAGLQRVNRFDPLRGIDDLGLEPCSRAAADQRAGRAGRTAPGRCIRLWSPLTQARMPERTEPEIARVDLAPFLLTLKGLHGADTRTFPWYEAPEHQRHDAGEHLLAALGACVDAYGALTPLGQRLARLPTHPRIGRLLLAASEAGRPHLGAAIAAVLSGRDLRRPPRRDDRPIDPAPTDLSDRLDLLQRAPRDLGIDQGAIFEARRTLSDFLRLAGGERSGGEEPANHEIVARLCIAAWPDRLCVRAAPDANRAAMSGGMTVELDETSALAARKGHPREPLFLALSVQGINAPGRASIAVRLACAVDDGDLNAVFPGRLQRRDRLTWDAARGRVESSAGWWWDDLLVKANPGAQADPETIASFLADNVTADAERIVRTDVEAARLLDRLAWLTATAPDLAPQRPDLTQLVRDACTGCRSRANLEAKPWHDWLTGHLGREGAAALTSHAPDKLAVPSGSQIRLDYSEPGRPPILAVRLQELFGSRDTPTVAGGRIKVLLHLLGPNYRPEQVTDDLAGFWARTYP